MFKFYQGFRGSFADDWRADLRVNKIYLLNLPSQQEALVLGKNLLRLIGV